MEQVRILTLDKAGMPTHWATVQEAVVYKAKGLILWTLGDNEFTLHGGVNRSSGVRSQLTVPPIISVDGTCALKGAYKPPLSQHLLFKRDRHTCAYCGDKFGKADLTRDHIIPSSRGGKNSWMNLVTACFTCNCRKDDRTPEEAGMKLLYVPYVPNRYEAMILANRRILQDQMDYLVTGIPTYSRILNEQGRFD